MFGSKYYEDRDFEDNFESERVRYRSHWNMANTAYIAVAGALVLLIVLLCCCRRRRNRGQVLSHHGHQQPAGSW
ncbi:unnamed protein product [Leptidea sinapis]|uniref:Uncharacterized protein n=1 Tax=Leptidea sinapis TaxID=189913 RepID=A0A5E4PSQ8_9NEOP|nr:unnamed protein product [Leptidea sinapis]